MSHLSNALLITCRDERDAAICAIIGITEPGAYAIREPDGRIMVWESEAQSVDDDGSSASFRSDDAESDDVWDAVCALAYVDEYESI